MKDSSPWVPIYTSDIIAAIHDWPPAAQGVYLSLLLHQADRGSLPDDWDRQIRAMANGFWLSDAEWETIIAMVKPKFEQSTEDGLWRNPRMSAVMEERNNIRSNKVQAAKRKSCKSKQTPFASASTTTTTNDSPKGESSSEKPSDDTTTTQLQLPVFSAVPEMEAPPRSAAKLFEIMSLPVRALTDDEKRLLESKTALLTPAALESLKAWYPKGRKRRRKIPDALIYFLTDLEACLDKAHQAMPRRGDSARSQGAMNGGQGPPSEFLEWLGTADIGALASLRERPQDAWRVATLRGQYEAKNKEAVA